MALNPHGPCPCRKRRCAPRDDQGGTQREDGRLQAQGERPEKKHLCPHLDLGFPASRTQTGDMSVVYTALSGATTRQPQARACCPELSSTGKWDKNMPAKAGLWGGRGS